MAILEAIRRQSDGRVAARIPGSPGQSVRLAIFHDLPGLIASKGDKATGKITMPSAPIGAGFADDFVTVPDQDGTIRNFIFHNGGPAPPLGPNDVLVWVNGFSAEVVAQILTNAINSEFPPLGVQATLGALTPAGAEVLLRQAFSGESGNLPIVFGSTGVPDPRVTVEGFDGGTDNFQRSLFTRRIASRIPGNPSLQVLRAVRRVLRRLR